MPIIEISTGKILNHKLCLRSVHSPPSTLTYAPSLIPRLMRRLGGEGYEARENTAYYISYMSYLGYSPVTCACLFISYSCWHYSLIISLILFILRCNSLILWLLQDSSLSLMGYLCLIIILKVTRISFILLICIFCKG